MKRFISLFLLFCIFIPIYAKQYKINEVIYDIEGYGHWIFGKTNEYALENTIPVDTTRVFENEQALNIYISSLEKQLSNLRAFEKIDIFYEPVINDSEEFMDPEELSETPELVNLNIYVKDSFHLFAIPGPKYDSNSGLTFKLKIIDSNFLGGLNELNSDIFFLIPTQESDGNKFEFGFNCSFDWVCGRLQ